jgi:predicted branched-subunit amino acid permease
MTTTVVVPRTEPGADEGCTSIGTGLRGGSIAMLPLLAGVAPLGLLVGAAVAAHGEPGAALAGTWLVYGASAHLALLQLTDSGAGLATVAATCLLINARLVVYAATLGRHWRGEGAVFKAVMAFTIVDPSFAVGDDRYRGAGSPSDKRAFYVGAAGTLWFGWAAAVGLGMAFGGSIGQLSVLSMALPVCLVAMAAPALRNRPGRSAVATSIAVALSTNGLPAGTGLLIAIVAGAVVGAVVEGRTS